MNGYLSRIKNTDRIYYLACPNDNCRKKVHEDNGRYRCDNCNTYIDKPNATYFFTAKISDFSESLYVNFVREQGEAIIGMPAGVFKEK